MLRGCVKRLRDSENKLEKLTSKNAKRSALREVTNYKTYRAENGEAPAEASVEGAREVGPAIFASTITTLVIFLPLISRTDRIIFRFVANCHSARVCTGNVSVIPSCWVY
jgi:hypothetical protein